MKNRSVEEALIEAGNFFVGEAEVQKAARRLAETLAAMKLPFAICGGLAVFTNGYRRTSDDLDVLISRESLAKFKEAWLGRGWEEKAPGSKGLRDVEHDVGISVIFPGEFPGNRKPKPVVFPDPDGLPVVQAKEGFPCIALPLLLELKLASGMTAAHRLQDLADAQELIKYNNLPREYAQRLNPHVREKFREIWSAPEEDR